MRTDPSQLREAILMLFRNRPELAPELLRSLKVELPAYTEVRIEQVELTCPAPDKNRSSQYDELILRALREAARAIVQAEDPNKDLYQSEFARRLLAEGRVQGYEKGEQDGRAAVISRWLAMRFGLPVPEVQARIAHASISQLDAIAERLLTASTLRDALGTL